MRLASSDIRTKIIELAAAKGITLYDIVCGREPTAPANVITIYDTGGETQDPKFALDEVDIQIRARSKLYPDGYNQLDSIKKLIEGINSFTIDGIQYIGIYCSSNIAFMKYDDNDRALWTSNYRLVREPLEASERGNRQPTTKGV